VIFVVANFSHSAKNIVKKGIFRQNSPSQKAKKNRNEILKIDRNRHNCLQHERVLEISKKTFIL
jgi:hypothetical protein